MLVSQNNERLMATPRVSIDQYEDEVTKATSSSEAIVASCPNPQDYSNFSNCFSCKSDEYFNVQYKTCDTCDGTINETTRLCAVKIHFVSDVSNPNIVNFPTNRSDEQAILAKLMQENPNYVQCNSSTPFYNGSKCINC